MACNRNTHKQRLSNLKGKKGKKNFVELLIYLIWLFAKCMCHYLPNCAGQKHLRELEKTADYKLRAKVFVL